MKKVMKVQKKRQGQGQRQKNAGEEAVTKKNYK